MRLNQQVSLTYQLHIQDIVMIGILKVEIKHILAIFEDENFLLEAKEQLRST